MVHRRTLRASSQCYAVFNLVWSAPELARPPLGCIWPILFRVLLSRESKVSLDPFDSDSNTRCHAWPGGRPPDAGDDVLCHRDGSNDGTHEGGGLLEGSPQSLHAQGRYAEAVAVNREASKRRPDDPVTLNALALSLYDAGDYAAAWIRRSRSA